MALSGFDEDVAPVLQQLQETAHADVDKKLAAPLEPVIPDPHPTVAGLPVPRRQHERWACGTGIVGTG